MRILVVDTDPRQLETIRRGLFVFGHEAVPAASAEDAARLLASRGDHGFDLLLTDVRAPEHRDVAVLDGLRQAAPSLPILVVTGLTHAADVAALRAFATALLVKPFTPDELDAAVRAFAGRDAAGR